MAQTHKERLEDLVQGVFIVTGALLLFFAGYEVNRSPLILSFILMMMGIIVLMIRVEYIKEDTE